jgi:hypothetical protein
MSVKPAHMGHWYPDFLLETSREHYAPSRNDLEKNIKYQVIHMMQIATKLHNSELFSF